QTGTSISATRTASWRWWKPPRKTTRRSVPSRLTRRADPPGPTRSSRAAACTSAARAPCGASTCDNRRGIMKQPTRVRHVVVTLTTLAAVLLYLDRFCLSFTERFIKEDLRLSNEQMALLLSAFFWTYSLAQVPSGYLTDRFGARRMLTLYILSWSLFT